MRLKEILHSFKDFSDLFFLDMDVLILQFGLDLVLQEVSILIVDFRVHGAKHPEDILEIVKDVVLDE